MVKSMTGYGKRTIEIADTQLHVEVRSVNHRFLDISPKVPSALLFLEDRLKRCVKEKLSRGRIDLFVTVKGQGLFDKKIDVDWPIVDQYISKLQQMKSRYELTGEITIDMVSKLEDVFIVQEVEEDSGVLPNALLDAVEEAVERLLHMRIQEGEQLLQDLCLRIENVRALLRKLDERRPFVIEEYKKRIRSRVEEYTKETIPPDTTSVLQEIALLAEKGDVTEEITRLNSHIVQFENTLDKDEPVGRQLEFIVQEMYREANTIGSKSNDGQVMETVIDLKSEIEKMKEQVQNVE